MSDVSTETKTNAHKGALDAKKTDATKVDETKTDATKVDGETPNLKNKPTVKAGWVLMQHAKSGTYRQCLPANVRGFERAGFVVAD